MLDKIIAVTEGEKLLRSFTYHMAGQIASATRADGRRESYLWDGAVRRPVAVAGTLREPVPQSPGGLMIHRNGTEYTNDPAVTGGNPVLAGGKVLFNDLLGNTLGAKDENAYRPVAMTAFGETDNADAFFTGKPLIGNLGYAFLFRNYRAEQGKWQTADPFGYPDGWNNLAYVNNSVTMAIDWMGGEEWIIDPKSINTSEGRFPTNTDWETVSTSPVQRGLLGNWIQVIERKVTHAGWSQLGSASAGAHDRATQATIAVSNATTVSSSLSSTISTEISAGASQLLGVKFSGAISAGVGFNTSTTLGSGYVVSSAAGEGMRVELYQELVNINFRTYWYYVDTPSNHKEVTGLNLYSSLATSATGTFITTWKYKKKE